MAPSSIILVWLDCRALELNHNQLVSLFIQKAHLALNDGEMFGEEGRGFMRMNVAVPRSILKQALDQLRQAVTSL